MPYNLWQQAAHTTYQLSSPSCSTKAIQKSLTLNETYWRVFWRKKSQENGPLAEKWQDRKSKRTRQEKEENKKKKTKSKEWDRKGEPNDSPEIPDRRMTSDIPGLPSGHRTSVWSSYNIIVKTTCPESWLMNWYQSFARLAARAQVVVRLKSTKVLIFVLNFMLWQVFTQHVVIAFAFVRALAC